MIRQRSNETAHWVASLTSPEAGNIGNPELVHSNVDLPGRSSLEDRSDPTDAHFIELNFNGYIYQMLESSFRRLPIVKRIVDESLKIVFDEKNTIQYFIEHNGPSVIAIIEYFNHGELHIPKEVCMNVFKRELTHFEIDCEQLSPCCYREYSGFNKDMDAAKEFRQTLIETDIRKLTENMSQMKRRAYLFLERPSSSKWAWYYNCFMTAVCVFFVADVAIFTDDNFRIELTNDQWLEYYSGHKQEITQKCAVGYANMTQRLKQFCIFSNNGELANRRKRHVAKEGIPFDASVLHRSVDSTDPVAQNVNGTRRRPDNRGNVLFVHENTKDLDDTQQFLTDKQSFQNELIENRETTNNATKRDNSTPHVARQRPTQITSRWKEERPLLFLTIKNDSRHTHTFETVFESNALSTTNSRKSQKRFAREAIKPSGLEDLPANITATSDWLSVAVSCCITLLCIQNCMMLWVAPFKWEFVKSFQCVTHTIAIITFLIHIVINLSNPRHKYEHGPDILHSIQVVLVFEVLKNSKCFKVLRYTCWHSMPDVSRIVLIALISCGLFSVITFNADKEGMESMSNAYWFAICAMTSVNYGDVKPTTALAKMFAGFIAFCGLCFLAIMVSLFAYDFNFFYDMFKNDEHMKLTRKQGVVNKILMINAKHRYQYKKELVSQYIQLRENPLIVLEQQSVVCSIASQLKKDKVPSQIISHMVSPIARPQSEIHPQQQSDKRSSFKTHVK